MRTDSVAVAAAVEPISKLLDYSVRRCMLIFSSGRDPVLWIHSETRDCPEQPVGCAFLSVSALQVSWRPRRGGFLPVAYAHAQSSSIISGRIIIIIMGSTPSSAAAANKFVIIRLSAISRDCECNFLSTILRVFFWSLCSLVESISYSAYWLFCAAESIIAHMLLRTYGCFSPALFSCTRINCPMCSCIALASQ